MVDVCLILEGTYPYATGGVSSWVHSLITGLPDIEFSLVHLFVDEGKTKQVGFELPSNLRQVIEVEVDGHREWNETVSQLEEGFDISQAGIYHALSTGLAGVLGTKIKQETKKPLILTEHGIYWKEIESGADEVECGFKIIKEGNDKLCLCTSQDHWTATFIELAKAAYDNADEVVTVCLANQKLQLLLGASPNKCSLILNGVEISDTNYDVSKKLSPDGHFRVGFVGRIVSIKDIKTLIKACCIVSKKLTGAEFLLIGPTDQSQGYYQECLDLVREAELSSQLRFVGEADPWEFYPFLDVMVLTSISEGQPFAVLEAMSCGIPVVVTDVGGCSELVYGVDEQDFRIGSAGIVTPIRDPEATARAILRIASDPCLAESMSSAARRRVRTFYTRSKFIQSYRELYAKYSCDKSKLYKQ
ncbi:MAG: GT4 family glycosyltransferase PelF [Chloroflexota bacterium]|nr:GT4 family glycosyltransferase PelF [Chloroflexota bacterium]